MDYRFLSRSPLFIGCSEEETRHMMSCLKHHTAEYINGERIYAYGQEVQDVCVVLSGSVQIESIDVSGNRSILGMVEAGDIFAESYACIPGQRLLVNVVAREDSQILFINVPALFAGSHSCGHASKLIQNLLRISARKNLSLSMRIFHSTPKTIRARLTSYFSEQTALHGSGDFTISMDRQQLADYLGVDRTALSKELGKMRKEGLLRFHKNEFHLSIDDPGDI